MRHGLIGDERVTKITGPSLWVQWKGTEVCAEFYCKCGDGVDHIDSAGFMYYVRCSACRMIYLVNPNVELVPLTEAETEEFLGNPGLVIDLKDDEE